MKMNKRLYRSVLKKNHGDEKAAKAIMERLDVPIFNQDKEQAILEKRPFPDFPLLENLHALNKQGKLIKEKDILPQWVIKQVEETLTVKDDKDVLWFTYWTVKMASDKAVALAVAKIKAKWHTGDSSNAFFKKLNEYQEKGIEKLKPYYIGCELTSIYPEGDFTGNTHAATSWRRNLHFRCPFDDRDISLDSENERRQGYGLPKEDFDKDLEQVAWLLGFTPFWGGYVHHFLWPSDVFFEVPRNSIKVSTSKDGVTITIKSRFVSREYLSSSYMWEQIKKAIESIWWNYEEIPSTKEMVKFLESSLELNRMPHEIAKRRTLSDDVLAALSPKEADAVIDNEVEFRDAHKSKRWRVTHRRIK